MSTAVGGIYIKKEKINMSTAVIQNRTAYKTGKKKQQKKSGCRERIVNYMKENAADIACSLIVMNSGFNGYHLYADLRNKG